MTIRFDIKTAVRVLAVVMGVAGNAMAQHPGSGTRDGTFSGTFGASYLVTQRVAFMVDAFYPPLWVQRNPNAPTTNDGLFNVRSPLSYTFR
jgi:hypothetical protein